VDRRLPYANVAYQDGHVDGIKWGEMKKYHVVVSTYLFFYLPGK
jgi:prepilin-type processing-associated H-X9-DG protein